MLRSVLGHSPMHHTLQHQQGLPQQQHSLCCAELLVLLVSLGPVLAGKQDSCIALGPIVCHPAPHQHEHVVKEGEGICLHVFHGEETMCVVRAGNGHLQQGKRGRAWFMQPGAALLRHLSAVIGPICSSCYRQPTEGEWMVAATVVPSRARPFTKAMTSLAE